METGSFSMLAAGSELLLLEVFVSFMPSSSFVDGGRGVLR